MEKAKKLNTCLWPHGYALLGFWVRISQEKPRKEACMTQEEMSVCYLLDFCVTFNLMSKEIRKEV